MTNTRITDAEVFERRYPVILREFSLRDGSRGEGQHVGGNGVVRDIEFRIPVQVSILSERRVYHPYGLEGGGEAACGLNIWVRKVARGDGETDNHQTEENTEKNTDNKTKPERKGQQVKYTHINLGGKNTATMQSGERIIIKTPGGGGWGKLGERSKVIKGTDPKLAWKQGSIASRQSEAEASA